MSESKTIEITSNQTTLADGLNIKADLLKGRKNAWEELTNASTSTHDKEEPPSEEDRQQEVKQAKDLLETYLKIVDEIDVLTGRIDRTNRYSQVEYSGKKYSIHELVTLRESIITREKNLRALAKSIQQASSNRRGYGSEDTKTVNNLEPRDLKKQADQLAKEARNVNILLQKVNGKAPLLE